MTEQRRDYQQIFLKLTENMRARNEVDFIKWLTAVGNGENMYDEDLPYIAIPPECKSSNLEELVDFCFPNNSLEDPLEKIDDLKGSMILCTKNDTVFTINDMLLDKIPNEERVFKSIDTPILDPEGAAAALLDVHAEDYNVESANGVANTQYDLEKYILELTGAPTLKDVDMWKPTVYHAINTVLRNCKLRQKHLVYGKILTSRGLTMYPLGRYFVKDETVPEFFHNKYDWPVQGSMYGVLEINDQGEAYHPIEVLQIWIPKQPTE
ncbi:hypothetical protein QR680_017250 [Steinernema hermaphroditum]|uniref:DNA helicase n=1 Tax=Steinernema hermaphroditum TaxID=289476 RepID=A0AA39HDW3_9BILA|nr:hypothetical protein QR680_017250 [Steinernema hermaphroditum]